MSDDEIIRKTATVVSGATRPLKAETKPLYRRLSPKVKRVCLVLAPVLFYVLLLMVVPLLNTVFSGTGQDAQWFIIFLPVYLFYFLITSAMICGGYFLWIYQKNVPFRFALAPCFLVSAYLAYSYAKSHVHVASQVTEPGFLISSIDVGFGISVLWLVANAVLIFGRSAPVPTKY